jgi:hypothetical protein
MMPRFLTLLLILVTLKGAFAQGGKPDWVRNRGTSIRYNEREFLTGFGLVTVTRDMNREDAQKQAIDHAKAALSEKVRVRVKNVTELTESGDNEQYSEMINAVTTSESTIELVGLKSKHYLDNKKDVMYALAYANRNRVIEYYTKEYSGIQQELKASFEQGNQLAASGERNGALKKFSHCFLLHDEMINHRSILMGLGVSATTEEEMVSTADINAAIDKLTKGEIASLEDLSDYLSFTLATQFNEPISRVVVSSLTYQDSQMSSRFSKYFRGMLEGQLVSDNQWYVINLQERDKFIANRSIRFTVRGTYWVTNDKVSVRLYVKDLRLGTKVASTTTSFPVSVLERDAPDYLPANLEERLADQQILKTDELVNEGIFLDVWTNKGEEDLIFTEGEKMHVYVKVNMPCHLRFTYHVADGSRVHFFDRYISENQVNQRIDVYPQGFECDCTDAPCGVETLQINAQEKPFPALDVEEINGYRFIVEDLKSATMKTRGFKTESSEYKAERRLVLTTMPN